MIKNKNRAFTLVELIISIAIIGVILSLSMIAISDIRLKARDAERLSDIRQIQTALELYKRDEGYYPDSLTLGSRFIGSTSSTTYMQTLPHNPNPRTDGACPDEDYFYMPIATSTSYQLGFCLGGRTGDYVAGDKCASPSGIANEACCSCSDMTKNCCPNCQPGDQCGGGWLYSDSSGNYYVAMPSGCPMNDCISANNPSGCHNTPSGTDNPTCTGAMDNFKQQLSFSNTTGADEPGNNWNDGSYNTAALLGNPADDGNAIDGIAPNNAAALYCYNLVLNGQDDWYLPALDPYHLCTDQSELDVLFRNSSECATGGGSCTCLNGSSSSSPIVPGFNTAWGTNMYWSSNEWPGDAYCCTADKPFYSGTTWFYNLKNSNLFVRCIRQIEL